jgi:uncharacterized membrane protein YhaH (DUF805 family)
METVYCAACGKVMSVTAQACPDCGHPNRAVRRATAPVSAAPAGLVSGGRLVASPTMAFSDAIKSFFTNYAVFSGRARRSEYWLATLFVTIISLPISFLDTIVSPGDEFGVFTALGFLWSLATFIPSLAIASRRLHDTDTSFGYFFMILIPIVGVILLIVKLAEDGTRRTNRFGESTKYSG